MTAVVAEKLAEFREAFDALPVELHQALSSRFLGHLAEEIGPSVERSDLWVLLRSDTAVERAMIDRTPDGKRRRIAAAQVKAGEADAYDAANPMETIGTWAEAASAEYMTLLFEVFAEVLGRAVPKGFPSEWRLAAGEASGVRLRSKPTPKAVGVAWLFHPITKLFFDRPFGNHVTSWDVGDCFGPDFGGLVTVNAWKGSGWTRGHAYGQDAIELADLRVPFAGLAGLASIVRTPAGHAWFVRAWEQLSDWELRLITELSRPSP